MKRMLVMSDLHCGHLVGLTPPRWQIKPGCETNLTKREKFSEVQSETWRWYAKRIKDAGPFDVVIVNGDAIDGQGTRSGATELITADREEQCAIAVRCIKEAMNPRTRVVMTYGTAYHTGNEEDWEALIAREVGAKIGSHEWVDVDGVVFDLKHHIGSSGLPHGRQTAISRDAMWSHLWSERGQAPDADWLIRSHVHYHSLACDYSLKPHWRMSTPALQACGTKYGSRRCSGVVDFGFVVFECDRGTFDFTVHTAELRTSVATVVKL